MTDKNEKKLTLEQKVAAISEIVGDSKCLMVIMQDEVVAINCSGLKPYEQSGLAEMLRVEAQARLKLSMSQDSWIEGENPH